MHASHFQGAKLREAREARGLTSSALSELAHVSPQSISQYELGKYTPLSGTIDRLSSALKVPHSFFFRIPRDVLDDQLIFWRSNKSAKTVQRKRVQRRFEWFADAFSYVGEMIQFPNVNLPSSQPLPNSIANITEDYIEQSASELRSLWSLGTGPITNLVSTMECNGCMLTRIHMEADHLDAFSQWKPNTDRPFIALNADKDSRARSLFDAAHELGHMILHRGIPLKEYNTTSLNKQMEGQADFFASCLLLPTETFTSDLYSASLDAYRDMKRVWHVSMQAMIRRSLQLDLITEDQYRRLCIRLSKRGWRKCEPGDEDSNPEQPVLFKHSIDLLRESAMYSPERFEAAIGISTKDIEGVTGLPMGYLLQEPSNPYKLRLVVD